MTATEGKIVEISWNVAGDARARFRLLKVRSDIGFVKLCSEAHAADTPDGFWVEIGCIREIGAPAECNR
jgi:hypothetical protein